MKFRKKLSVVDAWQWDETADTREAMEAAGMKASRLGLFTKYGTVRPCKGDWIVKDTDGCWLVYTPGEFASIFEEVPRGDA